MARTLRLALGQVELTSGDTEANFSKIEWMAAAAGESKADLLCLPELTHSGYFLSAADTRRLAEPPDGAFAKRLARLAKANGLFILAGYPELDGHDREHAAVYNSCLLVDDEGRTVGNARKVYLWGKEKEKFSEGNRFSLFDTRLGKIGVLNCYDAEFPEPGRILGLKGAELILVPAAWSTPGARRWEIELAANAMFYQLFVAGANQVNPYCCGTSQVIGPDGVVRAIAPSEGEMLLLCDIDLDEIAAVRQRIPYYQDFKPDTFSERAVERY